MNRAQLSVLGVSAISGGLAFMMTGGDPPQPIASAPSPEPVILIDHVLVAARDLSYGTEIADPDMKWIEWPKSSIPPGVIAKSANPNAEQDVKSSLVRIPFSMGEPIRRERLVKGSVVGVMSTMLAPGKRAIAIDVSLNSTAGGFILPNDRVDVLRTYRDGEASKQSGHEVYASEVILKNIRVLAVGQTIEKKGTEPVASGSTATLELDPREAEFILRIQRSGQLTLILRPITDVREKAEDDAGNGDDDKQKTMTIVKRGAATNLRIR